MRNLNPLSISYRFIRKIQSFFLLAVFMALSTFAMAENYPSKPIHLIVPFPAGGAADVTARQVGQILSTRMGQQVVIENRPGAGGNIAAASVAKAAPDGYTILYITGHMIAVNPHIVKNPGFDSLNDFVPIIIVGRAQTWLSLVNGLSNSQNY